jgi:hypothetical protein
MKRIKETRCGFIVVLELFDWNTAKLERISKLNAPKLQSRLSSLVVSGGLDLRFSLA